VEGPPIVDALTARIRDALMAEGASPATAEQLAVAFVERSRRTMDRERRENLAQALLPLGPTVAAERLGVCKATIYNMVHRHREKSKKTAAV
jgi:DNA-directed RNA polymerase specialized sigma24 family protein